MKKFNFSKGLVIGLLTLALVLTGFATVKASANAGDSHTVTFQAKVGTTNGGTYEFSYKEGTGGTVTLATVLEKLGKADECLYVKVSDPTVSEEGFSYSDGTFTIGTAAAKDLTIDVAVKSPVVTFNVTVEDMLGEEAGDYTFTADTTFQKQNASIQASAFLGEMKKANGNTLADAAAWVVADVEEEADDGFAYSNGKFTLDANLADNLTIALTVTNSKAPVSFAYDGYTATFLVENKTGDTKIFFTDIVDGLKKKVGEEDKTYAEVKEIPENIIPKTGFATGATTNGKYATWFYTVKLTGVVTEADDPIAIGEIKPAFIENAYDPATDSIKFVSEVDLDVHWIDCKKAAGVQVKGEKLSTLSLKENKVTDDPNKGKFEGYISLTSKDDGVKIAESKAAYIYASIKAPAADKTKYTANYVVDPTPYKKIAVTFNYTLAQKNVLDPAIVSITTIGNDKKTVVYSGWYDAETNPDNYLWKLTKVDGVDTVVYSDIFKALQYSTDGATWYKIVGNPLVNSKQVNDLNLDKLYSLVNGGSKTTLYFRIKGEGPKSDDEGTADVDETANAYRATKPVKATVDAAKAGKAVKVDVSKGTLALKNGYDFTMTAGEKDLPAFQNAGGEAIAFTILPFNKGGKATEKDLEGNDVATAVVPTVNYVPVAKVTENAEMFTNIKVKAYSIDDIAVKCKQGSVGSGKMYIWVRKSATTKKAAEQWTLITLAQITAAPTITKAKGATYYAAQAADDTKGVIGTPEIKNGSGDKNSGAYEYLIVDAADIKQVQGETRYYADIDYTSAKWATLGDKGLTVGKSKSKYASEAGKKPSDHVLKDGSVILVRRAGDKSSNVLASQYIVTMVVKQDVEIEVEKDGKKEKETKSLYVWTEYKAQ